MMHDSFLHISECSECGAPLEENETSVCIGCGKTVCAACIKDEHCGECRMIYDDEYDDDALGRTDIEQI